MMRRLLLGFLLALGATVVKGQTPAATERLPAYRARLLGVYDARTGDVIAGAEVIDVLSKTKAVTTTTGTVTLAFLPDGGSMVRVQKIGYTPSTTVIPISPADTLPFTVLLEPAAQTLPAVISTDSAPNHISPGLRAFEERRRTGVGRFLGPAELRKNDNRKMTDLIRGLGVQVQCDRKQRPIPCYAVSNRQLSQYAMRGGSCPYDVYIDGTRIMNLDSRDLERIAVNETGAVEAYAGPASIPPAYNQTGSSCGVLLFWTRER